MAEDKERHWQQLVQAAIRDTDSSKLLDLIRELNHALRERKKQPKPQLVRAEIEPELLEFRHDHTRFRRIFDEMHQFAGLLAPDGRLTLANRSLLEFSGTELETVFAKPLWELHNWDATEGARERVRASIAQAAHGEFIHYDVEVLGQYGPAWIDFSITPIRDSTGRVEMLLAEGKPYPQQVENPIADGEFLAELLRVEQLRRRIRNHVVTVCASCHRIRDGVNWYLIAEPLVDSFDLTLTPCICPDCEISLSRLAGNWR